MNEITETLKLDSKRRRRVKHCPCGKSNKDGKFVPFAGYDDKGYCHSCGKTFLPDNNNHCNRNVKWQSKMLKTTRTKIDFIPISKFMELLVSGKSLFHQNHFIQWMENPIRGEFAFDHETVRTIIEKYYLGNSIENRYHGWVLFPYIDINGNIRDVKAMDYDPGTGKRIKEPHPKCVFIGKQLIYENDADINTERCFFGEHLLSGNNKPVQIFESEATATYASSFYENHVCLATGGKNGVRWSDKDLLKVLSGRQVTLFPDLDAHKAWEDIAKVLKLHGIDARVSNLLFDEAKRYSEEHQINLQELVNRKFDLRDILQYQRLSDFRRPKSVTLSSKQLNNISTTLQIIETNWDKRIEELEFFFKNQTFTNEPIRLNGHESITDVHRFIETSLLTVKDKNGNPKFLPYLLRLELLKQVLSSKS